MAKTKFYRVVKDTPAWAIGAIVSNEEDKSSYRAVTDLWNKLSDDYVTNYYEASGVVEHSDFFERVYEMSWLGKQVFVGMEKARQMAEKLYRADDIEEEGEDHDDSKESL